jgi:hypothetical protein
MTVDVLAAIAAMPPGAVSLDADADRGVVDPSWLSAARDRLMEEASSHHGACDDGDLDPADLDWRLVLDLPIGPLTALQEDATGWARWFEAELAMFDEEHPGRAAQYRALMDEPLDDPIVVTIDPGRVQIWDGWHRTATRIVGGAGAIPAIVGTIRTTSPGERP